MLRPTSLLCAQCFAGTLRFAFPIRFLMAERINTREWAEFYGVTQRSVQKWLNDCKPVAHPEAMAKLILNDVRSSPNSRAKASAILGGAGVEPPAAIQGNKSRVQADAPQTPDPEWAAFMTTPGAEIDAINTQEQLKRLRVFYLKKLETATKMGVVADIRLYTDQVIEFEEAINKNLLMAKRLGIDAGELLSREAVEKFLDAFAFLLMRGADDAIDELSNTCVGKTFPEEIRPLIEDYILSTRILRPFRGVVNQASGLGLPQWFVSKLQSTAAAHIDNPPPLDEPTPLTPAIAPAPIASAPQPPEPPASAEANDSAP